MNQSVYTEATILVRNPQPASALQIPKLSSAEVIPMAREEISRFVALLESLAPSDWGQPTDCTLWTVKDVVAHQVSHTLALTHYREIMDQFNPLRFREYSRRGMNFLDAANQRQVDKRASWTPAQLINEIRTNTEASLQGRQHFPAFMRWMPVITPGYEQRVSFGELIDNIFTRDMWMHRLDICRSTQREMAPTADHDGRITALVIRDLDQHLAKKLGKQSVIYHLRGLAGGEWLLGGNHSANTSITMDIFDFHRLASGRINGGQALQQGLVEIKGDQALGKLALQHTIVLY
jgi:uncharacterized protein (TIGR03083 family)